MSVPAVNYYQSELDRLKLSENVAQVFMGMRIQCAQCHNHPFDRWTMNDYYGFNAFFAQIGRKKTDDPQEVIVFNSNGGESQHFLTKKNVRPKFLGGEEPDLKPGDDRRRVMAEWLASPRNPYFARNIANLVWAHFLGVGVVDPVDDVRVSNPPSNPELLDELLRRLRIHPERLLHNHPNPTLRIRPIHRITVLLQAPTHHRVDIRRQRHVIQPPQTTLTRLLLEFLH